MMQTIIGILLFAVATAIVYGWGLLKNQNKEKELMNVLYEKGEKKIFKLLKNNNCLTKKEIENEIKDTTASLFYSKSKVHVTDSKLFTYHLIKAMSDKNIIVEDVNPKTKKRTYRLLK